ncbi:AAA family ATPase [Roseinatronobacter monicus]|uniref:AAA family ATPase n=1 Tax=Roseinatronobacter monicus TaxID=393481 RepID=UPI003F3A0BE3
MRLERLGLMRYGHFTDAAVTFPRPAGTAPDLHVIYGPNEAGKSTLFSAWLDLLFGIPTRTAYNFLHDNRALRIEADISSASGALALARLKGNTNTLLDRATDAPLPEAALGAALGGLDRDAYTTMFSLDDDTLESGGESILDSKGDLGQLLFSASAGLADLSEALRALHEEGAAWFRPTGRKFQLSAHKTRLAELVAERKAVDLQVSAWRKLSQTRAQAEASYLAARARRSETQTRAEQLRRDLDALPMLQRLNALQARLAELPEPQPLPADWGSALTDWMREEAELAALLPEARRAQAECARALDTLKDDPEALALLPRLEGLEGQFGAIARQQADLPKRREELAELQDQMTRLVDRLERPGLTPADAILAPTIAQGLADLIEADAVLRSAEAIAQQEMDKAQRALQDRPDTPPLEGAALARLAPLVEDLRRADLLRHSADAAEKLEAAQAARAQAFAALAPWQGTAADLAALDLPSPDSLRALDGTLTQAMQDARAAQGECDRLQELVARLRADTCAAQPVSAAEAAAARTARDAAWTAHLGDLTRQSAEAFAVALQADDAVSAARLEQAGLAERLRVVAQEHAALDLALARNVAASQQVAQVQAQVSAHWALLGVKGQGRHIADLIDWLARRHRALEAQARLHECTAAQRALADRLGGAAKSLGAALAALGRPLPSADYATSLAEAEALLATAEVLRQTARLRADLDARALAVTQAQQARADWQKDWDRLCAATWIGTPAPTARDMRARLAIVAELDRLAPQADTMMRRIARIEEDIDSFTATLTQLAQTLNLPPAPQIDSLWPQLRQRLKQAQATQNERARLQTERAGAQERLDALALRHERLHAAIAPLQAHFGTDSLAEIARQIDAIARATELSAEYASLHHDLAAHLRASDPVPEIARLGALDVDQARAEAETLAATLAAQDDALRTAYADLAEAEKALEGTGHDGAAARLEAERQTLLLQIEDEAAQFMARQAGVIAVEQALRLYRDTHRSTMMARAADAFALLTAGRYTGLSTQPDGRGEILIAQQAGGATKPVDTLSKGTRFQLYLALRAAGYLELATTRPCVPFIADDIMETFDDTRAEAAFRLLAQMAGHGQVIYLTHHAHLCEIARKACPDVQLHDLRAL